ncbi:glutamate receptor ionotropic, kainate 2 [Galendromus occidentalis]|uniref:Glutamate receptor ionotropic, kainate 2 n=1 Tax=Galendromus occidentalis TaxID=34638 RepID=A0AAJ7WJC1_9ACAR|nr:glutamate receptor ionotropic, kainate 2 [Galendromus occidentalis]
MWWILSILLAGLQILANAGDLPVMKIGALLDEDDAASSTVIDNVLQRINGDHKILPRFRLQVVKVRVANSFVAAKTVCSLIDEGCVAIIGPTQHEAHKTAQEISARLQVPFFVRCLQDGQESGSSTTFHLLPPQPSITRAFSDIIRAKRWKNYALIYEKNQDLIELADLVKDKRVLLYQYQKGERGSKRLIREIGSDPQNNYIVHLTAERANEFFRLAGIVGLLSEYFSYLVTAEDFHTWQLPSEALSNITALQLLQQEPGNFAPTQDNKRQRVNKNSPLKYHSALLHDYIMIFARAVGTLSRTQNMAPVSDASCHKPSDGWPMGLTIATQIKATSIHGLFGHIQFDTFGERSNYSLLVTEYKDGSIVKVGNWSPTSGINYNRNSSWEKVHVEQSLRNRSLRVVTLLSAPYVMRRRSGSPPAPGGTAADGELEGFCIDLLHELSRMLHFKYEIRFVNDSRHGARDRHGHWDGLIRDILDMEADVALADLTVTSDRARVVSFTTPFMASNIEVLYKPPSSVGDLASLVRGVFSPLSQEVWISGVLCLVVATFVLFYASKLSPRDRIVKLSPKQADERIWSTPRFSFGDIVHIALSCALRQPLISRRPRGVATRILILVLYVASFVFWSVYTARLTAQFVQRRMHFSELQDVGDLLRLKDVHFGYVANTSSQLYLQGADYDPISTVWAIMTGEGDHPTSSAEGLRKVHAGGYAFFLESPTAEYHQRRDCSLLKIHSGIETSGYAIATPRASPYTEHFSSALMRLKENEVIHRLQHKWFSSRAECKAPPWGQLDVTGVSPVLLLLGAACALATVIGVVECACSAARRQPKKAKAVSSEPKPPPDVPDNNQLVSAVTALLSPAQSSAEEHLRSHCKTLDLHTLPSMPNILPPADLYMNYDNS